MKNPALQSWLTSPKGLATLLAAAMREAGLSQQQLADLCGKGWTKSRVNKLVRGTQMPTPEDVQAWAEACEVDPEPWLDLIEEGFIHHSTWSKQLLSGQTANQRAYVALAEQTDEIWSYDPALLPGELQTSDYAAAVLTQSLELHSDIRDITEAVNQRKRRRLMVMADERQYRVLFGEAALRTRTLEPAGMVRQCEMIRHVIAESDRASIGLLPLMGASCPSQFARSAFVGYDETMVIIEPAVGEIIYTRSAEVETFRAVFDLLASDALFSDDLLEVLDRVTADWMRLT